MTALKKTYHVDLPELMRTYETNYAKLNALLPAQPSVGDVRCYQAAHLTYQLQVLEVTKYTTLVEICQSDDISIFPLPTRFILRQLPEISDNAGTRHSFKSTTHFLNTGLPIAKHTTLTK